MVLPLPSLCPKMWATAVVVIVLQSIVELFGMVAHLWLVPRLLARSRPEAARE